VIGLSYSREACEIVNGNAGTAKTADSARVPIHPDAVRGFDMAETRVSLAASLQCRKHAAP
jgi:hypothetical protein